MTPSPNQGDRPKWASCFNVMAKKIRIMKVMSIGQNVELGWEAEAADLNLGNQTLDQVKELGTQAQGAIDALAKLRNEEQALMAQRDGTVLAYWEALQRAKHGCLGNSKFGRNSSLYKRWGYVRDDDRKSGLTHKPKDTPGEADPEAG